MSFKSLLFIATLILPTPSFSDEPLHDECLVGLWQADLVDLAHIYAQQMQADNALATGDVRMRVFANGNISISVQDLAFDLDIAEMPPMKVTINGGTDYETVMLGDGAMSFRTTTFDLTASADVLGTPMVIPLSSSDGLFGSGLAEYGCSEETLSFESGEPIKIPRRWLRMECNMRSCPPD